MEIKNKVLEELKDLHKEWTEGEGDRYTGVDVVISDIKEIIEKYEATERKAEEMGGGGNNGTFQ